MPNSNVTGGNFTLSKPYMLPNFIEAEVSVAGKPTIIASPVGNGIRFTNEDHIVYKFPVSEPWPCPFNITQCLTGFTMSFWFRWEYVISSYYRYYMTLGSTFSVYRPKTVTENTISMKWNADGKFSWYHGSFGNPGKWNLITWKVNRTHSVGYLNGLKWHIVRQRKTRNIPSDISNELHFNKNFNAGNFSVGPMQLWASGKSPVFIWRLFQEGLDDYNKKWLLFVMSNDTYNENAMI